MQKLYTKKQKEMDDKGLWIKLEHPHYVFLSEYVTNQHFRNHCMKLNVSALYEKPFKPADL